TGKSDWEGKDIGQGRGGFAFAQAQATMQQAGKGSSASTVATWRRIDWALPLDRGVAGGTIQRMLLVFGHMRDDTWNLPDLRACDGCNIGETSRQRALAGWALSGITRDDLIHLLLG